MLQKVKDIKQLTYSKTPKINNKTGKTEYPRDISWLGNPSGFGIRIFPSGKKSFVYQYRNKHGQRRLIDVGAYGDVTLEEARKAAHKMAYGVMDGQDPLEEKQKVRNGKLMSDLCATYIKLHARPNKRSWLEDERRNSLYIIPAMGTMQVQQIKRRDIAELHSKIGIEQGKPYMANRVREQLSKMFELAKIWGYIEETHINPAKGIDDFAEHERDAYIKPEHMPIVAAAIEKETNIVARCALWMYLITGKRKNELLQAKWEDIDQTAQTLRIAGTKNGEVEYLPLSDEAFRILARVPRQIANPYIFPGNKPGSHLVNIRKPWLRIRTEAAKNGAEGVDKVTIHGLRHTVGVWLTNLGNADLGLVRKIFNHKSLVATKVYAKYKLSTARAALQKHGKLVRKLSKPSSIGTIVTFSTSNTNTKASS